MCYHTVPQLFGFIFSLAAEKRQLSATDLFHGHVQWTWHSLDLALIEVGSDWTWQPLNLALIGHGSNWRRATDLIHGYVHWDWH